MTGKAAGHGDHWRPLWGDDYDPQHDVLVWVRRALVRPAWRDLRDLPDRRRLEVFHTAHSGLGMCVLLIGETVITAYPYVRGGPVVTLRVRDVVPWQNGFEAQVVAEVGGLTLAFFAVDAYRHLRHYQPGRELRVVLNGLLYGGGTGAEAMGGASWSRDGKRVDGHERARWVDAAEPTLRTLAGERLGSQAFDIDDFALAGPVSDAAPQEALGCSLVRFRVALPAPDRTLPVYLRPEALDPQPRRSPVDQFLGRWPLHGQWLRGHVWLQAHVADG